MTTATTAPIWTIAVNAVMSASSMLKPISFSVIVRWPVLEIGRNSVKPSTAPRMIASRMDTAGSVVAQPEQNLIGGRSR